MKICFLRRKSQYILTTFSTFRNEFSISLLASWPSVIYVLFFAWFDPDYEGTPTEYCKDQAVFDAGAVPSQFGSWNIGTSCWHILSCHPQYPSSSKQLDRQCSEIFSAAPVFQFMFPFIDFFLYTVPLTLKHWLVYMVFTGLSWPFLIFINKINKK